MFRCDQVPHPVKIKVVTGSKSGSAWPAEQAPYCLKFLGRLLRAHGNVECSPRFVHTLGAQQAYKKLAVLQKPRTGRIWSVFQIRQDGVFTGSAEAFPSVNSKAPIKSWIFTLNQSRIWGYWWESGYITLVESVAKE